MHTAKTKSKRAFFALALCAALGIGFLAGCNKANLPGGERTTAQPPAQETGLKLKLYQPHKAQAGLWQALAADYKALTGVNVEVVDSQAETPAIFLFTGPREHKDWRGSAVDLSGNAAYGHLVDNRLALKAGEKVVGLPLGVEAFGIVYNKKILNDYFALEDKKSGLKSVADVKTYKELEALAKDLHERRAQLGIDGAFAAPALKEGESAAWTTRLLGVPLGYEIEKQKTDVTGEGVEKLELRHETGLRGFYDLYLAHGTAAKETLKNRAYADAVKEFATGKAAMTLGGTDFIGHLNSAVGQSVSAEQCAFLPAFMNIEEAKNQGLAFEAVEYAAVSGKAGEEEIQAAGEFLNWLCTSEKGMDFLANKLSVLAPYDTVTESALPANPLSADAFAWLKKEGVQGPVIYTMLTPGEEFRDKVFGGGLLAYATGEDDWNKFRTGLKEGWAKHASSSPAQSNP